MSVFNSHFDLRLYQLLPPRTAVRRTNRAARGGSARATGARMANPTVQYHPYWLSTQQLIAKSGDIERLPIITGFINVALFKQPSRSRSTFPWCAKRRSFSGSTGRPNRGCPAPNCSQRYPMPFHLEPLRTSWGFWPIDRADRHSVHLQAESRWSNNQAHNRA